MDCDVLHKVKKLYRIQDAFVKYNIFDKNAFENDQTFQYILKHFEIENTDFQEMFQKKYTHEISKSNIYKKQKEEKKEKKEKSEEQNEDTTEKEPKEEKQIDDEIELNNKPKNEKIKCIKEIDKTMYKKIAFLSHPDKTTKTENIVIFKQANEYMNTDWTIGLVYCSSLLKIKLDFIYITDEVLHHCFKQMRNILQEIIQLYNIRNS